MCCGINVIGRKPFSQSNGTYMFLIAYSWPIVIVVNTCTTATPWSDVTTHDSQLASGINCFLPSIAAGFGKYMVCTALSETAECVILETYSQLKMR